MAKPIKALIKLQIPGGAATPAPPVGSSLGQHGVNLMDFCKRFNADTATRRGETVPVVITVYSDRSFSYITKTPPATELIKKKARVAKGASVHTSTIATITWKDVEDVARVKMADLNAYDLDQAKKIIAGSARSMGIEVKD
jgi:large subunit ribosomal protein L11